MIYFIKNEKNIRHTYDNANNITSDSFKDYAYDEIYRVTGVNDTASGTILESFNYDDAGNRTTDLNNEYTSNILNQYTTLSGSTNTSYVYDNNENITDNGEYSFEYDYKNRLLKVSTGSTIIAEFNYDVLGRRIEKTTSDETTTYVYSDKNVLEENKTNVSGTFKKTYINGIGLDNLVAYKIEEPDLSISEREELKFCDLNVLTNTGGFITYGCNDIVNRCEGLSNSGSIIVENIYYFSKNHLGSVDGITDNNGNLITSYEYNSFGNFTQSGSNIDNTRLYIGREYDEEIGLYYLRARYYDSEIGRFISRDPIGQVDDINLYAYVGNNSVMFVDRMGTEKKLITEKLVISIFDLGIENTKGFNFLVFQEGTKGGGAFDIKRNEYIRTLAAKNGGVINFNGVDVEPSNLGNMLAGINMKNSYLPSWKVRSKFFEVEVTNAHKEGYGKYSEEIAKWDENTDEIWYDIGEEIYYSYKKSSSQEEKINIITQAIQKTNPEYYERSQKEKEKREYYRNLLSK